jgi:anti-sigma factor RsiW
MREPHSSDEQLDQYAMGTLPEESLPEVEEHLLVCETCQERLTLSDEFVQVFRAAAAQPDVRARRAWWSLLSPRTAGWTAAAAVAALVLLIVGQQRTPTAPAVVFLQSLRGPEASAQIAAGKPAILVFDIDRTARASEVQVVDTVGTEVLKAPASVKDGQLALNIPKLAKGSYWVRVYRGDKREIIAEYGLQAR